MAVLHLLSEFILAETDFADIEIHAVASGRVASYSRRAPDKPTVNEDAAAALTLASQTGLLVVADGAGGFRAGEVASRLAIQEMIDAIVRAPENEDSLRDAVLTGIENANRAVLGLSLGAATTLVAVEIQGRTIRSYHVGDSTMLVVGQRGRVKLQTISHSPVGYAVEAGVIDAGEAMQHEERHLVSNLIGTPDMRLEIGSTLDLAPYDTVILASDGLFDNLHIEEIVELVRCGPLDQCMAELVDLAQQRMANEGGEHPSKPDDLTILIYRLA